MIRLVRDSIAPLIPKATDGHAGLLMQRGLQVWEESSKEDKQDLVDLITHIRPSELYLLAFNRWLNLTYSGEGSENSNPNFASINAQIDGRLFTGLSIGGTLETGAITQHSYGMPMLPGSAVKGAVRRYAESLFTLKDAQGKVELDVKGKTQIDPSMRNVLEVLFGTDDDAEQQNAGYLIWHDAWWVPPMTKDGSLAKNDDARPFVGEIITVHHQKYYSGISAEALDMESPIPNQQIAIQGGFYFVIEGKQPQWVQFAKQLLENMLQQFGMGAKGAAGYGYFKIDEKLNKAIKDAYIGLLNLAPSNSDDPLDHVRRAVKLLEEKELIESLSKGIGKFFTELNLDKESEQDCKNLAQIVREFHPETIQSWQDVKGQKNIEKALKFINKYP